MIIKTTLALILTASLAGSAVYYGTQSEAGLDNEVALGDHPHKPIEQSLTETMDDMDDQEDVVAPPATESSSELSTIDRLLNRKRDDEDASISPDQENVDEDQDGQKAVTETTTTTITETVESTEDEPEMAKNMDSDIEVAVEDRLDASQAQKTSPPSTSYYNNFDDTDKTIEIVMAQIENIEAIEIKDQAHFDVVTYALRHQKYVQAELAISKISNVDFRDTARGQYAVALAKNGQPNQAFELLKEVEVEELRDVLRLKVIEAMILPTETQ